jgi:hypothetical protein
LRGKATRLTGRSADFYRRAEPFEAQDENKPRPYKVVEPAFSDAGVKGAEVFAGSDGRD